VPECQHALVGSLISGLVGGLTTNQIMTRTIPNEGIQRSLRNALISFLIGGLVGGLVVGLVGGLIVGLVVGLQKGGFAYFKHHVLRFLLWRNGYAPWNYIRFLDYAAKRVFVRKVGGGYIFTHRLLMEYFATLEPIEQAGQAKAEQRQCSRSAIAITHSAQVPIDPAIRGGYVGGDI
jgi:hypothetical protein